ncbi:MAG: DUF2974 domain-containing protein [Clostridia bacterium]|nr:DUF2974 domain-containing protein [Clostridia bacterium]
MANLFDYLDWRGDLSFEVSPINEVDSLILSQISYVDFGGIVSSDPSAEPVPMMEAVRAYLKAHKGENLYLGRIMPPETLTLMVRAAKSRRFGALTLVGYENRVDEKRELQFSAVTFLSPKGQCFLAYRGTDDTLIGWKENFNMSFMQPVPAQTEAVLYLEQMAEARPGDFTLCGHSKGGNLAVYAAVKCRSELKKRIMSVYSNDGPGFDVAFVRSEEYKEMKGKLHTIVPQSSVVGLLLEHAESHEVIRSTAAGLLQHNAFSWEVLGNRFIHLDSISEESRQIDTAIKDWMKAMKPAERERFVDSFYQTVTATGAKTLTELNLEKIKLLKIWNTVDPVSRSHIMKLIPLMVKQSARAKSTYKKYTVKK